MLHLLLLYSIRLSWDKFAVHHFVGAAHSIFDNFARHQRARPIITCSASRRGCSAFAFSCHFNTDHGLILSTHEILCFWTTFPILSNPCTLWWKKHCAHMKCSKWRKKYLKVSEIEMSKIKFPSAVYNILSAPQVKIIAIASLIKSNTDSDMHAWGRPIKKAPLLNSAQSWKLWQVYYGSHLQLKVHSSVFEILAPGH